MDSVGVILVGADALVREGLARVLTAADFRIIASRPSIGTDIAEPPAQGMSHLLLVDIGDDLPSALEQVAEFKKLCPAGRVAMLAHRHRVVDMLSAFRAGANAYFVKITSCEAFIKSLELVMLGETVLPPAMLTILDSDSEAPADAAEHWDDDGDEMQDADKAGNGVPLQLSTRHKSILRCLVEGDSNKIIARKMSIAEATVKVHVKAILRRIHVHNRTQAAIWAVNSGLFIPLKGAGGSAANGSSMPAIPPSPITEANGVRHAILTDSDLQARGVVHQNDR
jgi:two-component system nitrate/nitrite response regulator NarL